MAPLLERELEDMVKGSEQTSFMNPECGSCQSMDEQLQLAAAVGKALLDKNNMLAQQNTYLQQQLEDALAKNTLQQELDNATAQIKQLQHTLKTKDHLLLSYENELKEIEATPSEPSSHRANLLETDRLQGKLTELQLEISALEADHSSLQVKLDHFSEKESCLEQQLLESHNQIADLKNEVLLQADKEEKLEEKVQFLTGKLASVEKDNEICKIENEHFQRQADVTRQQILEQDEMLEEMQNALGEVHAILKELQVNKTTELPEDDEEKESLQVEISNSLDTIISRMCEDDRSMNSAVSRKIIKLGSLVSTYCDNLPGFLNGRDLL